MSTLFYSGPGILEAHSPAKRQTRRTITCLKYSVTKFIVYACKGHETGNQGWKAVSACRAEGGGEGTYKRKATDREYELLPEKGTGGHPAEVAVFASICI